MGVRSSRSLPAPVESSQVTIGAPEGGGCLVTIAWTDAGGLQSRLEGRRPDPEKLRGASLSMDAAADGAHDLGDLLGDDHDLALLRRLLDGKLQNSVEPAERRSLLRAIGKRREVLQSDAADLGQRVYVESPRRFVGRVHEYWKAWR